MSASRIRPKVVCVFRRASQILVAENWDTVKKERYYVPPGGGVEFGEYSSDAVRRELQEELSVELEELDLLGVRETVFEVDGAPGHEVVFVYAARCGDPTIYERDEMEGVESSGIALARARGLRPGRKPTLSGGTAPSASGGGLSRAERGKRKRPPRHRDGLLDPRWLG